MDIGRFLGKELISIYQLLAFLLRKRWGGGEKNQDGSPVMTHASGALAFINSGMPVALLALRLALCPWMTIIHMAKASQGDF